MRNLIHVLSSVLVLFTFTAPLVSSDNALYSGFVSLEKGQMLSYKDYALRILYDCSLVLSEPGQTLWKFRPSKEDPSESCYLQLYEDGELFFRGIGERGSGTLWSSGVRSESGNHALVLGHDGSLKIYGKSIWSTPDVYLGEKNKDSEPYALSKKTGDTYSTLWSGDIAPIGTIILGHSEYYDKIYKLELGTTCNLTLTELTSNAVLWHTNTIDFRKDCFVKLESNGELKIMYMGGRATLWSNNAPSVWGQEYVLGIDLYGQLQVYGPVIWSLHRSTDDKANIAMVTA